MRASLTNREWVRLSHAEKMQYYRTGRRRHLVAALKEDLALAQSTIKEYGQVVSALMERVETLSRHGGSWK